jgi:peptidyl-tRNA hydrolase, PTH1 family
MFSQKLIFSLGNPEPEYKHTRHNVGKDFLNYYAKKNNLVWEEKKDLNVQCIKTTNGIFVKPNEYMNQLGSKAEKCLKYFNIADLNNFLVVYDDLDLVSGDFKFAFGKGSRIHNGLHSIINQLDTNAFWQMRIGVREEKIPFSVQKAGGNPAEYVLENLPLSDSKKILETFDNSLLTVLSTWLSKI